MTVSCPICKVHAPRYFSVGDMNQHVTEKVFDYYRCSSCRLIFINPIPEDLASYYMQNYPAYQMPSIQELDSRAKEELYKLEILQKYISRGRLLEIGPSFGAFAYLAKQAGFEVEAIEMDANCCRYLTEVVGIKAIHDNNIILAIRKLESYDAIVFWHAIEHLADPWAILEAAVNKLSPGGVLIIAAPNPGALQFRIFKRFWTHVDAPRHLQLIPISLMVQQLEKLGLKTLDVSTADQASSIFTSPGWWSVSLNILLKSKMASHNQNIKSNDVRTDNQTTANIDEQNCPMQPSLFTKIFFISIKLIKKLIMAILYILYHVILKPSEKVRGFGAAYTAVFKKPN